MNRVCITGGAGFIGVNLARYFVEQGWEVTVVDDLTAGKTELLPASATFHKLDVRDTEAVTAVLQSGDMVIHLAALPRVQFSIDHPLVAHDVNVNGTLSVLEAARATGVARVLFASSSAVYGEQEQSVLSLDLPPKPQSPYALHKLQGEEQMKLWSELYGVETVSIRPFNVYGPHMDPKAPYALVMSLFLEQWQQQQPLTITGDGTQTRDFIHVHDMARAIEALLLHQGKWSGAIFNLGSGVQTSINELAALIGGPIDYIEVRHEPAHTLADISKTTERVKWKPKISLPDGVEELKLGL